MIKTVLSIDGRKCPECEAHVNRLLLDHIKEAVDVKSSARKNTSIICSDNKINKEEAERALSGSGYKLLGITYEGSQGIFFLPFKEEVSFLMNALLE